MKDNIDIISIYNEVLSGRRKIFPMYTWSPHKGGYDNFKRVFRYIVLEKLKLDREALLQVLDRKFFNHWKIGGGLSTLFEASSFEAVTYAFPEFNIRPWELRNATRDLWLDEKNIFEAFRWLIEEKLQWSKEEFVEGFTINILNENSLGSIIQYDLTIGEIVATSFPEWNISPKEYLEIRYEKTSKFMKGYFGEEENLSKNSGENSNINKLTQQQVISIREKYKQGGETIRSLAKEYDISPTQTARILNNKSWR